MAIHARYGTSIATTNLLNWINFKLFNLNYTVQKVINYLIYGVLLLTIIHLKNKVIGRGNFRTFPAFIFFLLSPIAVENHSWAFQSQIHFVLLFFVLMLAHMHENVFSSKETAIFLAASCLALYSFAAGALFVLTCLAFRNLQTISLLTADKAERQKRVRNAVTCTLIMGGVSALWFLGYEKPDFLPPRTWPNEIAFWDYFLNTLSFGFGVDSLNLYIGIIFLILVIAPLCFFVADHKKYLKPDVLCISAGIIAVIAVIMSVSFGRANIGYPKTSRYVEISFMLIPFTAMAWWLLLRNSPFQKALLFFLWMACFIGYLDNWTPAQYLEAYNADRYTLDCVTNYYTAGGDAACQDHYITPAHLEYARKLKVNFARRSALGN